MRAATATLLLAASAIPGNVVAIRGAVLTEASSLRGVANKNVICPGGGVCSGKGSCDSRSGVCWCDSGFGGKDCANEVPLYMDITQVGPPELADMMGRYKLQPMYLMETVNRSNVKFIHYSPLSAGWAISKLDSACPDDICFFAYGPRDKNPVPPKKGYVYGGPMYHAYFEDLIWDEAQFLPGAKPGYHLSVKYRQDPHQESDLIDLDEFNNQYVLQPRYVHELTGKYAMFPVDFESHRTWIVTGMLGEPRKERVVMKAVDPSLNRYMPPEGPWVPAEYGMVLKTSKCEIEDGDTPWVRQCCRWTCGQCQIPRTACQLPHTNNVTMLLELGSQR